MTEEKIKPPMSADELLARYKAGERDFAGAILEGADLKQARLTGADFSNARLCNADFQMAYIRVANFSGADLRGADFRSSSCLWSNFTNANLQDTNLQGAKFNAACLRGADLQRAQIVQASLVNVDLQGAILTEALLIATNLHKARLNDAELDKLDLTDTSFGHDADLLSANWRTIVFDGKTYHRDEVERGNEVLPIGAGLLLSVIIETERLRGAKYDAASAVVDYLANAGIEAKVERIGGGGSVIRFSMRSKDRAEILLQAGDGVCRLLGLGSGVENLLPDNGSSDERFYKELVPQLDAQFDSASREAQLEPEKVRAVLDSIGRDDVRAVKLAGFTDAQMESLKKLAELGSEFLEVIIDKSNREAWMTPGQRIANDLYQSQVTKPIRTFLQVVFQSLMDKPEDV